MMPSGMIVQLRVLINDLDSPSTFSDERLSQVLVVAAQYVQQDLQISTYTTDLTALTITPDPTAPATLDIIFVNFTTLRAACFIDQSSLRSSAAAAGLKAVLGPMSLDTSSANSTKAFVDILNHGACAAYKELLAQYMFGNLSVIQAVLSPFTHNQFDPRDGNTTSNDPFFTQ